MEANKFVAILDKHIDQQALVKDLAIEYVLPFLEEKIANVDVVPGTDLDKELIQKALAAVKAMVLA